jgi:hypothetical protein
VKRFSRVLLSKVLSDESLIVGLEKDENSRTSLSLREVQKYVLFDLGVVSLLR